MLVWPLCLAGRNRLQSWGPQVTSTMPTARHLCRGGGFCWTLRDHVNLKLCTPRPYYPTYRCDLLPQQCSADCWGWKAAYSITSAPCLSPMSTRRCSQYQPSCHDLASDKTCTQSRSAVQDHEQQPGSEHEQTTCRAQSSTEPSRPTVGERELKVISRSCGNLAAFLEISVQD